jgi:hypothetical protein
MANANFDDEDIGEERAKKQMSKKCVCRKTSLGRLGNQRGWH